MSGNIIHAEDFFTVLGQKTSADCTHDSITSDGETLWCANCAADLDPLTVLLDVLGRSQAEQGEWEDMRSQAEVNRQLLNRQGKRWRRMNRRIQKARRTLKALRREADALRRASPAPAATLEGLNAALRHVGTLPWTEDDVMSATLAKVKAMSGKLLESGYSLLAVEGATPANEPIIRIEKPGSYTVLDQMAMPCAGAAAGYCGLLVDGCWIYWREGHAPA